MKNKWIRMLVCFVLVCSILVNISPIRAEAVISEPAMVAAGIVVASILIGLGVGTGTTSGANVFTDLVNDCVSVIQSDYDFIDEEGIVQLYTDNSAETAKYYAHRDMVEAVREWMFESETVTGGPQIAPEGFAYYGSFLLPEFGFTEGYEYVLVKVTDSYYTMNRITSQAKWNGSVISSGTDTVRWKCTDFVNWIDGRAVNGVSAGEIIWSSYDIYDLFDKLYFEGSSVESSSLGAIS